MTGSALRAAQGQARIERRPFEPYGDCCTGAAMYRIVCAHSDERREVSWHSDGDLPSSLEQVVWQKVYREWREAGCGCTVPAQLGDDDNGGRFGEGGAG